MTLAELLAELVREYGIGRAGAATASTTTTLTDAPNFAAPVSGGLFPNGSPIRITSGSQAGQNVYKTNLDPATGIITFRPAITQPDPATPTFVISHAVEHIDRLVEAINRTLTRRLSRDKKVPLTYVPDGDLQAETVGDFWTAGAGTASYVLLEHPEGFQRVLQLSHTTDDEVDSETFHATEDDEWEFDTYIRALDGTASLAWRDVANSADITVEYDDGTGSTDSKEWVRQRGRFTAPSDEIAVRLAIVGTDPIGQMAPVSARPAGATRFPAQAHLKSTGDVGSLYGTIGEKFYPVSADGLIFDDFGWGIGFHFQNVPAWPLYYDERMYYHALEADTDATDADTEAVLLGAAIEVWKQRIAHEDDADKKARLLSELTAFESRWRSPRIQKFLAPRKVSVRRTYAAGVSA